MNKKFAEDRAKTLNKERYKHTLIVKVTNKCNLTCPYCYNQKKAIKKEDMTLETVREIAEKFKGRIGDWTWHGGEPTLMGPDWYREAHKIVREVEGGPVKFSMQTHGGLINDDWIKLFKEEKMHPGLSFDGYSNDHTRKNTKTFMKKLKLLKDNGINSGAILVLTKDSINRINEEYELFKSMGLNGMFNQVFEVHDVGHEKTKENDDAYEIASNVIDHFEYWIHDKNNPIDIFLATRYLNLVLDNGRNLCEAINCTGKWLSIYANGDIFPCGRDWSHEMKLGNIHEHRSVDEIVESPGVKKYMEDFKDMVDRKCSTCPFLKMCNGGCPGDAHSKKGFVEPNTVVCESNKMIFTYIYNRIKNLDLEKEYKDLNPMFTRKIEEAGIRTLKMIEEVQNN